MTTTSFLTRSHHHYTKMDHQSFPDSTTPSPLDKPNSFAAKCWLDDACIVDIDQFITTLSSIKSKGVRPDLIGSIITHYACKWIPELSIDPPSPSPSTIANNNPSPPESATQSWLKKRFFIETIITVLPYEKNAVPCSFLLRLLKHSNMAGVDSNYRIELEKKVAWVLDHATLKELMIPCFSHVKGTLLDVELMSRLVKMFVELDIDGLKSGVGMFKVAKLVDGYLAEAAVDSELGLSEFMELAQAIPEQARVNDDGLYRAIDTYLKVSYF
ncbi:phototropic-responsive NPH3 family protein [Artemisia annua]|uniref:Phototropic-responsive NPH3 family protein n=1 Tax=Artemisia annua TaxID=35608 RepID=A0A2U1KG51_ARTAN|nr:phototropic-responsive NPH3 family protein [Artemisia annua]